ncbi:MAG: 16S rRNA (cytosine(967)-C(5))-methyltransferase RsmB [Candidatus Omnitrophota bacterium]|jgi:16S rRNA (cytosine967-C5)-methyltransferase|nr:MAG: 16S rRNA (cytosine(967)-C(5))-methyltransferase RsmB [Candidatus Omnitrophota bacterium]
MSHTKKRTSPARLHALHALEKILSDGRILDEVLPELEKNCRDGRDRALAREIVSGTCRWWGWIRFVLSNYAPKLDGFPASVQRILELSVYQLLYLDRVPPYAIISDAVELARIQRCAGFTSAVNGILRTVERNRNAFPVPNRDTDFVTYVSSVNSHPAWFVKRCREIWSDEEVESFLQFNNTRAPFSLRIRNQIQSAIERFETMSIPYKIDERFGDMVTIEAGFSPDRDFYESDRWAAQDGAASLVASLLGVKPGWRVWDVCAAPGGKTLHIADLMNGEGQIIATDRSIQRLERLRKRMSQLKCSCIHPFKLNLLEKLPPADFAPCDAVLVDVPCSGWGTFRRNPDLRWRLQPDDSKRYGDQALQLLENAGGYVRSGGILVYSTCTLSPDENEWVVKTYLSRHPEYQLESVAPFLRRSFQEAVSPEGCLFLFPPRWALDGVFAARLRKYA